MQPRSLVGHFAIWLAGALSLSTAPDALAGDRSPARQVQVLSLGLRGVHFVPNLGQWGDDSAYYGFRSRGLEVAFRESKLTMHLRRDCDVVASGHESSRHREGAIAEAGANSPESLPDLRGAFDHHSLHEPIESETLELSVTFPGSNLVIPAGAGVQTARFNYYVGDDESTWASDVPSYGEIIYEDLYDGINLHVMGSDDGVLKYEFHCAPGADHTQIRIRYDGIDGLCVDERTGDLLIETAFGVIRDNAPLVWQEEGGTRVPPVQSAGALRSDHNVPCARSTKATLPARFETLDRCTYTIALGATPDPSLPLVFDPEIEWMYYLGGGGRDAGEGVAVDSAGNALVTGYTTSYTFEGRNNSEYGSHDAFALKVSPTGQLQWMTYLGGSEWDDAWDIAADSAGNVLVSGHTSSADFAGRINSHHGVTDAFALKISPSGQLQWMTYLGGSDRESAAGIVVDSADNALVAGYTRSLDFTGRNNSNHGGDYYNDAYALKISPSGQIRWMTYLGGREGEASTGIAVDAADNALVAGWTDSADFAGANNSFHGNYDAFALKISPAGQLRWMIYLGGSDYDEGRSIAVDGAGGALLAGRTSSGDFVGRNNVSNGPDAFALKVSPAGQLRWMTYLGGSSGEKAHGVAADTAGNALVTGETGSPDFAGRNNSSYGYTDAFALKITPTGQLLWMTYLGGSYYLDYGRGIDVDGAGNALVAGTTLSNDFDGANNSFHGHWDAFLVRLRIDDGPRLTVDATCPDGGPMHVSWEGAMPDGQVALIFARNTGSITIQQNYRCPGVQLGLGAEQIQLAWRGLSGPDGSRILNANAPRAACGGFMQLLDLTTCSTSNVATIE